MRVWSFPYQVVILSTRVRLARYHNGILNFKGTLMRAILFNLSIVAIACGCAAHPDPIVDMKGVDREEFAQDWAECES